MRSRVTENQRFSEKTIGRRGMPDLQAVRKRNLRALIKEHGGPSQLAKQLGYAGPSYLSQLLTFVYECIVDKDGQINPQLVRQLIELLKPE